MKRSLLIFALISSVLFTALNADVNIGVCIDTKPEKHKASSVCEAMKKLPHDGHKDIYEAYINSLQQEGKTVCSCMQELMEAKRKNALQNIEKAVDSSFARNVQEDFDRVKRENKIRNILFWRYSPKVNCDANTPSNVCNRIKEQYLRTGLKADLNVYSYYNELAGVKGKFPKYELYIGPYFLKEYNQQGVLAHEFEHLKGGDADRDPKYSKSFSILQYQESRSDRIPAACGSFNDACNLYSFLSLDNGVNNNLYWYFQQHGYMDPHASPKKRFDWASRLFRLRKAETTLEKQMQQRESNYWMSLLSFG